MTFSRFAVADLDSQTPIAEALRLAVGSPYSSSMCRRWRRGRCKQYVSFGGPIRLHRELATRLAHAEALLERLRPDLFHGLAVWSGDDRDAVWERGPGAPWQAGLAVWFTWRGSEPRVFLENVPTCMVVLADVLRDYGFFWRLSYGREHVAEFELSGEALKALWFMERSL